MRTPEVALGIVALVLFGVEGDVVSLVLALRSVMIVRLEFVENLEREVLLPRGHCFGPVECVATVGAVGVVGVTVGVVVIDVVASVVVRFDVVAVVVDVVVAFGVVVFDVVGVVEFDAVIGVAEDEVGVVVDAAVVVVFAIGGVEGGGVGAFE